MSYFTWSESYFNHSSRKCLVTVRHPLYVVVPFRIVKMAAPANGKEVFAYFKAI